MATSQDGRFNCLIDSLRLLPIHYFAFTFVMNNIKHEDADSNEKSADILHCASADKQEKPQCY